MIGIHLLTSEIISKVIADNFSVGLCPSITTNSAPPPIKAHLHSSFKLWLSSYQSHLSISAVTCNYSAFLTVFHTNQTVVTKRSVWIQVIYSVTCPFHTKYREHTYRNRKSLLPDPVVVMLHHSYHTPKDPAQFPYTESASDALDFHCVHTGSNDNHLVHSRRKHSSKLFFDTIR